MSRFFVNQDQIVENKIILKDKEDMQHIAKVLRLGVGDIVEISDGFAFEYQARIETVAKEQISLILFDKQRFAREPALDITLYQGVPKQGKLETIIQKTTELGVSTIVPVFTARTVIADKGGANARQIRLQRVSAEAAKQCKRGRIPAVRDAIQWKQLLDELLHFDGLILFPYENETVISMKDALWGLSDIPKRVAVLIGPEGGFSQQEADQIKELGAKSVSLGKTILRTETAAIAAVAMILYELEPMI